jgi:hypothetical protein
LEERWAQLRISTEQGEERPKQNTKTDPTERESAKKGRARKMSVRVGFLEGSLVDAGILEVTNLGVLVVELEVSVDGLLLVVEGGGLVVVEEKGDLLERESLGFDKREPDDDEEDDESGEEDKVVLFAGNAEGRG